VVVSQLLPVDVQHHATHVLILGLSDIVCMVGPKPRSQSGSQWECFNQASTGGSILAAWFIISTFLPSIGQAGPLCLASSFAHSRAATLYYETSSRQ